MLWISPLIRLDCPKLPQYPPRSLVGSDGPAATLDFTNATADAAFQSAVRKLVELGVDGFKVDRGEEADLEGLKLAGGPGVLLHNKYPLLFAQTIAAGVKAAGASSALRDDVPLRLARERLDCVGLLGRRSARIVPRPP